MQAGAEDVAHEIEPRLPHETRPRVFATFELILDLARIWRARAPMLDPDSLLICFIVNDAAMRDFLIGPGARPDLIDDPSPPDDVRGSISRHLIAERANLSRETVRRKVNQLIEMGILAEPREGHIQPVQMLTDDRVRSAADESFDAVRRFDERLRSLGCQGVASASDDAPSTPHLRQDQ